MGEVKKVYKPLVEKEDRGLVSIWAGSNACGTGVVLEYKEGEITYAPEGSAGIWISSSLGEAQDSGRGSKVPVGVLVVYEVIPLGERVVAGQGLSEWSSFTRDTRYPAILLGKEVWREEPREPVRPEPKFKVGDKVVIMKETGGGSSDRLGHTFTISKVIWGNEDFGHSHTHYHYYEEGHMVPCDEDILELAPLEPEWVDVTSECTIELRNSSVNPGYKYAVVTHREREAIYFGDTVCASKIGDYKVEFTTGEKFVQSFRVFKKDC